MTSSPDTTDLIRQLVSPAGPPGEEKAIRHVVEQAARERGYAPITDAKGNLLVTIGDADAPPAVLVTAHLDEIALMITRIEADGKIRVAPLGGVYTWKWGEGLVEILLRDGVLPAVMSFGGIHTNAPESVAEFARHNPLTWERAYLFTGKTETELTGMGVRPGLRVILARSRRTVVEMGDYIASYFLDDRADVAVWLLALEMLKMLQTQEPLPRPVLFAATTSEEVGGEGALFILKNRPIDICVALEIGPKTPDADFAIDAQPTIWVRDGYAAMEAQDGEILTEVCAGLNQIPHWQYLSRGGSDASCAAHLGLVARPVTLGLPVENSHGFEIMHRDAPRELARLLIAYLRVL